LRSMTPAQLADFLVREAAGESTGIAAGFFGEIASHNEPHNSEWRQYRLWDEERTLFQAVAGAQRRTGLFISTHASLGRAGVDQLRTIMKAGGDPTRVVIGHCDAQAHDDVDLDLDYYRALLDEGTWLEFDLFGWEDLIPDTRRFERVALLVRQGFSDRLLLSTDTCRLSQLRRNGGRGFDYLFTAVLPGLGSVGVTADEIRQMTVTNPARMLTPL
jgi:predicted metal-dependent phosphotriesterase family hydrolase